MATTPKKATRTPTEVPGTVTAKEHANGWSWHWRSPRGTEHLGHERFPTKAKAMAAGRRFAKRSVQPTDDEGDDL